MKKKIYKKWWFWVLVVVVIGAIGSQLGDKSPEKVGEVSGEKTDTTEKKDEVFKVGDIIQKEGLYKFSVNKVEYKAQDGSGFVKAKDGYELIYVDVTIENMSGEEMAISSLLSFDIKDADGRKQDLTIVTDGNGQVDGTILKGDKINGEIVYQVPKDSKLNLYVTLGNIFTETPIKVTVR